MTDGLQKINDMLAYDRTQPVSYLNAPTLYICDECENTIFALQTWTGEDGLKGATKDWIDILRYMALLDLQYEEEEEEGEKGMRNAECGMRKYY
jgi:hypothetical protein